MSENACTYSGQREEAIVAYIYGEMAPSEHLAFAAHIEDCVTCQTELSSFSSLRKQLASWAPPELSGTLAQVPQLAMTAQPVPAPRWAALRDLPIWAQAVAALLVIGVAAGAANLRITSNADGLSVRTGWLAPENPAPAVQPPAALPVPSEPLATRAELAALEQRLSSVSTDKDVRANVLRETRALLAESERRQQNELALRMGTMAQDVQFQREADFARINRVVGRSWTDASMQNRQLETAYRQLAVRVSQQR